MLRCVSSRDQPGTQNQQEMYTEKIVTRIDLLDLEV